MSLMLCCPNCGSKVGESDHSDNYVEHFDNYNKKGEPICQFCGTGDSKYLWVVPIFVVVIILAVCFI